MLRRALPSPTASTATRGARLASGDTQMQAFRRGRRLPDSLQNSRPGMAARIEQHGPDPERKRQRLPLQPGPAVCDRYRRIPRQV